MVKRILILDDDKDILEILTFILTDSGYETKSLNHGNSVFEEILAFEPDLLLMDIMLGDKDGRVICKSLKENILTSTLPIILISATHDLERSLHQPGAPNDYLAKPFNIDVLLSKLEKNLSV